jgi:hypothetical protein
MLKKVISGGQTGADQGGIRGANKSLNVETGGWAPKGYRTENGTDFQLRDLYGLKETPSELYPDRTRLNVKGSDATLIIGDERSAGTRMTIKFCKRYHKPFLIIPYDRLFPLSFLYIRRVVFWIRKNEIGVLNVAGNRESKKPGISNYTERLLISVIRGLRDNTEHAEKEISRRPVRKSIVKERSITRR